MNWSAFVWLLFGTFPLLATTNPKTLYFLGLKEFHAQRYASSLPHFRKVLPLLKTIRSKKPKNSQSWHIVTLGQCDVFYHIAFAQWKLGQKREACLSNEELQQRLRTVPKEWPQWNVNPNLVHRFAQIRKLLTSACPKVPSLLTMQTKPTNATISIRSDEKQSWKQVKKQPIETLQTTLQVRLTQKGYKPLETKVLVPRWKTTTTSFSLEKKPVEVRRSPPPPPRRITRQLPPPPPPSKPIYAQWWFWTGVGVATAGATTTVLLLTSKHFDRLAPAGRDPSEGTKIWK